MTSFSRTNLVLALASIAAALLIAFLWAPMDASTGLIEKVRRQVVIGDALAPTLAAAVIGVGGALLLFQTKSPDQGGVSLRNLGFLGLLILAFGVSFALMRWAGPTAVALANLVSGGEADYRTLRDTAPWKYIGFFLGGSALIATMISVIEGRITRRALVVGLLATLALIVVYDVPFDDLLLPPNGDV